MIHKLVLSGASMMAASKMFELSYACPVAIKAAVSRMILPHNAWAKVSVLLIKQLVANPVHEWHTVQRPSMVILWVQVRILLTYNLGSRCNLTILAWVWICTNVS